MTEGEKDTALDSLYTEINSSADRNSFAFLREFFAYISAKLTSFYTTFASIVGVPVNNQVAIWTSDTGIEGSPNMTFDGTTLSILYDDSNYLSTTVNSAGSATFDLTGTSPEFTFSDAVNVPDEAYGVGWDGNTEVPTKNAVYDKIEAIVPNATHTGEVTGSTALTVDKTAITGKTVVTAVGADYILISDTSDSGNLKKALASDLAGGGGGLTQSQILARTLGS